MLNQLIVTSDQDTKEAIFGTVEGENAKKNKSNNIKTGTKRNIKGGGGRGGITKGKSRIDKARRTKIKKEYLIMHPLLVLVLSFTIIIFNVEPHHEKTTLTME